MGYKKPLRTNTTFDDLVMNEMALSEEPLAVKEYLSGLPYGTAVKIAGRSLKFDALMRGLEFTYIHCMRDPRAVLARERDAMRERVGHESCVLAKYMDWILFQEKFRLNCERWYFTCRFELLLENPDAYYEYLADVVDAEPKGGVEVDLARALDCERVDPPTEWIERQVAIYGY